MSAASSLNVDSCWNYYQPMTTPPPLQHTQTPPHTPEEGAPTVWQTIVVFSSCHPEDLSSCCKALYSVRMTIVPQRRAKM